MGHKLVYLVLLIALALFPVPAFAHPQIPMASVDRTGYTFTYAPTFDGSGFTDAAFSFRVAERWDLTLRYESEYMPDEAIIVDGGGPGAFTAFSVLAGARYHIPVKARADLYVAGEIGQMIWTDSFDSNVQATVSTVSLGGSYAFSSSVAIYGSLGSAWVTDFTGTFAASAYDVGLRLRANQNISVVAGWSGQPDHGYVGLSLSW